MNLQQQLLDSIKDFQPPPARKDDISSYAPVFEHAVLANYFDTEKIKEACRPYLSKESLEKGIYRLIDASYTIADETGFLGWQLKPEVRERVLEKIQPEKLRELLPAGWSDPSDLVQQTIGEWISGTPTEWASISLAKVTALLQVEKWLRKVVPAIPQTGELLAKQQWLELLEPHRVLTKNFSGRERELDELRKYVQWLPPESLTDAANRVFRYVFDLQEKPPLMITGLGGIGKTTLVSRFILDHVDHPSKGRVPFIYLDFDHPGISFSEPVTLLIEGVRQLSAQFPGSRLLLDQLHRSMQERLDQTRKSARALKAPSETALPGNGQPETFVQSASAWEERTYFDQFANAWDLLGGDYPLLVVLDSFEEVQRRLGAKLPDIFQFLQAWVKSVPQLRVVISGRWPITEFKTTALPLGDFDEPAAMAYLGRYGVGDQAVAKAIFTKFKGNPLTLRLAAGVVTRDAGPERGTDSVAVRRLFLRIEEEQVQQELFRRNLNHIEDPLARQVAMPGLILRRVTPGAIRHILAGPCNLGEVDEEKAARILQILRAEPNICLPDADDSLRFRQDLRRKMLPLIAMKESEKVREIHSAAVTYYENRSDPEDRADAVYHRLARGDDYEEVRGMITPDLQVYLENSLEEFPPSAYVGVAQHFHLSPPPDILALANLGSFEKSTAGHLQQALTSGSLEMLRFAAKSAEKRPERTANSKLRRLEAVLYERLGDLPKAEELALTAVEEARAASDSAGEIDLLLVLARLKERNHLWQKASTSYHRALNVALQAGNMSAYAEALILHVRLLQRLGKDSRAGFDRRVRRARKMDAGFPRDIALAGPLLPADLSANPADFAEAPLWRICNTERTLPVKEFEETCQKLAARTGTLDALEDELKRRLDSYLRTISNQPGEFDIQVFDIVKILEKDGRLTALELKSTGGTPL